MADNANLSGSDHERNKRALKNRPLSAEVENRIELHPLDTWQPIGRVVARVLDRKRPALAREGSDAVL